MDAIFEIESNQEFQKTLRDVICNYYSSRRITCTSEDTNINKEANDDLWKLMINSKFDLNKVPELLVDKGWDEEKIAFLIHLLNEKKTELLYASIIFQNSEYGEIITTFDWFLKLVLGTSELNTLKYPLFQLILSTNYYGVQNKIMYELNKDMLLNIINTLENLEEV